MTRALLIIAIIVVILLVTILVWPSAAAQGRSTDAAHPGGQQAPALAHAEPFATAEEFHRSWESYLRGDSVDTGRITETASRHNDWVTSIFPESAKDFHDGLSLSMGKYQILYPYMAGILIDNYGILLTEVSNNNQKTVTQLLKNGADPNKDFILTAATTSEMIDVLVKAGSDPNKPLPDGRSQRQYFLQLGRPDLVDSLIRNGAR